eukprot:8013224-Pyramimonas_sp.AAC.2
MHYNNSDRGAPRESRGFRGTAENAKTVLCTRFTSPEGCRFGDRCNFAHGDTELQPRRPRQDRYGGGAPTSGNGAGAGGNGNGAPASNGAPAGAGAGSGRAQPPSAGGRDPWANREPPPQAWSGAGRAYSAGTNGSSTNNAGYQEPQQPPPNAWARGGGPHQQPQQQPQQQKPHGAGDESGVWGAKGL